MCLSKSTKVYFPKRLFTSSNYKRKGKKGRLKPQKSEREHNSLYELPPHTNTSPYISGTSGYGCPRWETEAFKRLSHTGQHPRLGALQVLMGNVVDPS